VRRVRSGVGVWVRWIMDLRGVSGRSMKEGIGGGRILVN
jgi:hypothetical protein